jgi:hypothetical protein
MQILSLHIPTPVALPAAAVGAFYWAIKHRQFDDLESPAMIPLLDDNEDERRQQQL